MRHSFRDPDGFVFRIGRRVLRCIHPHAASAAREFLATPFAACEAAQGSLIASRVVVDAPEVVAQCGDLAPAGSLVLEHPAIPFAAFPYEWPSEMLEAAARLTLRLARKALDHGYGLKDATPYNVMFDGSRPVFLDLLSFEKRDPLDPIWRPYAQFIRCFLYPLLACRQLGLQIDELLLTHRDGLEPDRMRQMCSIGMLVRQPFRSSITVPELLARLPGATSADRFRAYRAKSAAEARHLLECVFARLERLLCRVPECRPSEATLYESTKNYNFAESAAKDDFVRRILTDQQPRDVLDIGCNTGRYSLLAAVEGARVVAIDRDPAAAGQLWRKAATARAAVLPLAIDIARPPGAAGWCNREYPSFLDRARGHFDCVLVLALVHHLIVNERAPLSAIFELLADLTTRSAVVEYVDPSDVQFQRILRGREDLHRDLTPAGFEAAAQRFFRISARLDPAPSRRLYLLEKVA